MGLQTQHWAWDIFRRIFSGIDWIIYSIIKFILYGIFDLSNLTTASGLLNGIYTRIYVLLGVFMAFKLSFSFFQYIVDPESMSGKSEKGVSKLITRTIVMLIALISIPSILFRTDGGAGLLQRAQNAFLPMLPRIVLGVSTDGGSAINGSSQDIEAAANSMSIVTLRAFFAPSQELDSVCGDGTYESVPQITSIDEFTSYVNLTCSVPDDIFNSLPLINKVAGVKYYKYTYNFVVSTIVGILLVIMLLGITIDVAKRVFKMIVLEAIAPIPIMSLVDPKSSKDGAFSHWLKSLVSTFLDLFIKLGLLYIVLMFMQLIVSNGLFENWPAFSDDPIRSSYLTVILILGLIYFAREAPKFVKDALGMKDSGAGLGTGLGMAVGAVGGLVGGRSLSGMLTGAVAGASADPKKGAYATARDTAGQIRTGDKNWIGGFGAGLQRMSAKNQGRKAAARLGLTEASVKAADDYASDLEEKAEASERIYQEALHTGVRPTKTDTNGVERAMTFEELRNQADHDKVVAAKARKNADKAKEDFKLFGVSRSGIEERERNRRAHSYVAKKTAGVRSSVNEAYLGARGLTPESNEELKASKQEQEFIRTAQRTGFDPRNRTNNKDPYNKDVEERLEKDYLKEELRQQNIKGNRNNNKKSNNSNGS